MKKIKMTYHIIIGMAVLFIIGFQINTNQIYAKSVTKTIKANKTIVIKTKKTIKKIKLNDFNGWTTSKWSYRKLANKKFSVKVAYKQSRYEENIQLKIKYKDGTSDYYRFYATDKYKEQVYREVKNLMKNPDKSIRTMISDFYQKNPRPTKDAYEQGTYVKWRYIAYKNSNDDQYTTDELLNKLTLSQKQAVILELYANNHMAYDYDENGDPNRDFASHDTFNDLVAKTYKGVCGESAHMLLDICNHIGIKAKTVECPDINHEWLCIAATDINGSRYWQGVAGTSYAYNMKWGANLNNVNSKNTKQFYKTKQSGIQVITTYVYVE